MCKHQQEVHQVARSAYSQSSLGTAAMTGDEGANEYDRFNNPVYTKAKNK